ncbi:3-phytase A [Cytospora mali]|uniref:3-phytase n=1 Tax=Cytospora mali TaxID=578113 RepID=A0A194VUE7_CYTMA|nr:3-phytase A [Valsa mali]
MVPPPIKLKPKETQGYQLVQGQDDSEDGPTTPLEQPPAYGSQSRWHPHNFNFRMILITILSCLLVFVAFNLAFSPVSSHSSGSDHDCDCSKPKVPQYFQTSPELWAGPTATGAPAFLAQTRTFDPTATFVANQPLQTAIPIEGMTSSNESIFQMMGFLSPYMPSPGFGVNEYPLPAGAEIVQLQMLSRHGSRYPTGGTGSSVVVFGDKIAKAKSTGSGFKASGPLEFLNDWSYQLGAEILVPKGRQELFDSGILHSYMYSSLYNPNSKIIVRTTTQDRMLKSAENFMAGFFGLEWPNNATIEVIIEGNGFNNSLAGSQGSNARLGSMIQGYDWTIEDTYAAQNMCPYETVAYGFSRFCELFTYEEWIGFSYSVDLFFSGVSGFQSKTGRAVGIGYQQEVIARLKNHTLGYSGSQINTTLDSNTETFPLNQSLYLDFSHDTNIISVLAAMGLTQFQDDPPLSPKSYPGPHNFTVSHITPFGARLDMEVIRAPKPVKADRSGYVEDEGAGETKYIHFVMNQRTIPLGLSFPECDASRVDGWCELETFLKVQEEMPKLANFDETCYG